MKKTTIATVLAVISCPAILIILCIKEESQYFIPVILTCITLIIFLRSIQFLERKSAIGKPLYIQDWITNDIEIGTKFSLKFIGHPSNYDLNHNYKLFLAQTKTNLGTIDESLIVWVDNNSFSDGNYRKTKTKNAWGSDVEFLSK